MWRTGWPLIIPGNFFINIFKMKVAQMKNVAAGGNFMQVLEGCANEQESFLLFFIFLFYS